MQFMIDESVILQIQTKYKILAPILNERSKRIWAACEAKTIKWGGVSAVSKATGISRQTIHNGISEINMDLQKIDDPVNKEGIQKCRESGGGRKPLYKTDQQLLENLEVLLESSTVGDPMSPLLWTSKSTRNLADALKKKGHDISHHTVARLLHKLEYTLQENRKIKEGKSHADRNAQFEYINKKVISYQRRYQPVVSIDAKKKELVGDFKNQGKEWHPKGSSPKVRTKDFMDKELGKIAPYGVYDVTANNGWVSVGIDHDTAQFAVESIRRWWTNMGSKVYKNAKQLLITADAGGSNGYRTRLWKIELQKLSDKLGLQISVCHYPPGTSKWNKIEHRMFCHITENWRGKPLISRAVVVNLIGSTKTRKGLKIKAKLDLNEYPTGIEVPDEEFLKIKIRKHNFHGEWNYTISPRC